MRKRIVIGLSLGALAYLVYAGVAAAATSICTTDGTQEICYASTSNVMVGTIANDRIWGDWHANTLKGRKGDDRLFGYNGQDTLEGGGGFDRLKGGAGEDVLAGGSGNDRIIAIEKGSPQRTDYVFCGEGDHDVVITVKGGVDYIDPDCEDVRER